MNKSCRLGFCVIYLQFFFFLQGIMFCFLIEIVWNNLLVKLFFVEVNCQIKSSDVSGIGMVVVVVGKKFYRFKFKLLKGRCVLNIE